VVTSVLLIGIYVRIFMFINLYIYCISDSSTEEREGGVGTGTGTDDRLWARRQFSVLWAPMPVNYDTKVKYI
jgi:hypothetical protein